MAEAVAGAGGSPGPAAAPSPRGSAGPQEDERCPGGASPESGGAAPAAHPEVNVKPPTRKGTPSSSGRKRRAAFSPGTEPRSLRLSPAAASPQGRRRSWRRSSLKGRRSRRRSLPPVHREVTELSQSISLELPEVQRLSLLLLSSFQFCARKLQQDLEGSEGFDPELFSAKVQKGSEEFQRLLQRLLQDGTLGNCLELTPGDSLDPALEGSVAQVKLLMASLSGELQAWDQLLQQHLQRSQEASQSLQQLRAGSAPFAPHPAADPPAPLGPGHEPGSELGPRPELGSGPGSELGSKLRSELGPRPEPGSRLGSGPGSELGPTPELGSELKPGSEPGSELGPRPEPGSGLGSKLRSEPGSGLGSKLRSGPGSEPGSEPGSGLGSKLRSGPGSELGSELRSKLGPRPDLGSELAWRRPVLAQLQLLVDEAQQAGKMVLEFHQQSRNFLRDLSEQLASRTFQKLPGSPARRLLQRRPQKAQPKEGE